VEIEIKSSNLTEYNLIICYFISILLVPNCTSWNDVTSEQVLNPPIDRIYTE
jgi:hypothetical protein